MTRAALISANRTEISGPIAHEIALLKIPFPSGTILITNHDTAIAWNGDTYQPGYLADPSGASGMQENITGTPSQATLSLSGVDASLIGKCISDACHWITVWLYVGYLDPNGALVGNPILAMKRLLGEPSLKMDTNTGSLSITLDSIIAALKRKSQVLGSDADQQKRFSGDTLFNQCGVNRQRSIIMAGKEKGINVGGHDPGTPPPIISGTGTGGDIVIGSAPAPGMPTIPDPSDPVIQ